MPSIKRGDKVGATKSARGVKKAATAAAPSSVRGNVADASKRKPTAVLGKAKASAASGSAKTKKTKAPGKKVSTAGKSAAKPKRSAEAKTARKKAAVKVRPAAGPVAPKTARRKAAVKVRPVAPKSAAKAPAPKTALAKAKRQADAPRAKGQAPRKSAQAAAARRAGSPRAAASKGAARKTRAATAARPARRKAPLIEEPAELERFGAGLDGLTEEDIIRSAKFSPGEQENRVFEEERFIFPETYRVNRIRLLVKDPEWLFAYWDVDPEALEEVKQSIGERAMSLSRLTLRITDPRQGGGTDILLPPGARWWYVRADSSRRSYRAELGILLPSGRFRRLAQSNTVATPRVGPSSVRASRRVSYDNMAELTAEDAQAIREAEIEGVGASGPLLADNHDGAGRRSAGETTLPGERGGASDVFRPGGASLFGPGGASETFRR